MIPVQGSYVAVKKSWGYWGKESFFVVEAWDDDGVPLVFDTDNGCLMRAGKDSLFHRVEEAADIAKISALPGAGWRAVRRNNRGADEEIPVLAWVFATNGWAAPVIVEPGSLFARPLGKADEDDVRLLPPDPDPHPEGRPAG